LSVNVSIWLTISAAVLCCSHCLMIAFLLYALSKQMMTLMIIMMTRGLFKWSLRLAPFGGDFLF